MILLDCCYEGDPNELEQLNYNTAKLLGLLTMRDLQGQTNAILKALNRMVGPDPAVFSTTAGNIVSTVKYTFDDDKESVGPLCRRAHIVLKEKLKNLSEVSLLDFMLLFTSESLDTETGPAISYWEYDPGAFRFLKSDN